MRQGDLQCHGLVAPGEKVCPRSRALTEKEVRDESPSWAPLSFILRVGPARTPPTQQLLEQVGWSMLAFSLNPGPTLPQSQFLLP